MLRLERKDISKTEEVVYVYEDSELLFTLRLVDVRPDHPGLGETFGCSIDTCGCCKIDNEPAGDGKRFICSICQDCRSYYRPIMTGTKAAIHLLNGKIVKKKFRKLCCIEQSSP